MPRGAVSTAHAAATRQPCRSQPGRRPGQAELQHGSPALGAAMPADPPVSQSSYAPLARGQRAAAGSQPQHHIQPACPSSERLESSRHASTPHSQAAEACTGSLGLGRAHTPGTGSCLKAAASPRGALQDVSRMPQFNNQLLRKSVSPTVHAAVSSVQSAVKRQRTSYAVDFDDDLQGLSQIDL